MLVKMLSDHEDSLNGGRTAQRFKAGQTYDVPEEIGLAWIGAKAAVTACPPAPGDVIASGAKQSQPGLPRRKAPRNDKEGE